jgi:cold shock CspA family protein
MSSTETPDVSASAPTTGTDLAHGRVKWFNNKAGYGFVTLTSGEQTDEDVFVHHSAIDVAQEQYRYLIQGEYVEFKLCNVSDNTHKWQAGSVKGINNGKLMCETRHETREVRSTQSGGSDVVHQPRQRGGREDGSQSHHAPQHTGQHHQSQSHHRVRTRGPGPREGEEWMLVRRRVPNTRSTGASSPTNKESLRSRPPRAPYQEDGI